MKKIKYTAGDWCAIIGSLIALAALVEAIAFYTLYPTLHDQGIAMFKDYTWGNISIAVVVVYFLACGVVIGFKAPLGCTITTTTTKTLVNGIWETESETITREFDEEEIAEPVLRKGA